MAVEPQMQRRWEEQLAGYVAASFRVLSLSNTRQPGGAVRSTSSSPPRSCISARRLVIDGDLTVGELVAFNMLAGRVSAPVLRLAQMWQDFHQARLSIDRLGDILNTAPEPSFKPGRAALPAIRGDDHLRARQLSAIASTARRCCTTSASASRPARSSASSAPPAPARARSPS